MEKLSAEDVPAHLFMTTKAMKLIIESVLIVELVGLLQRRTLKGFPQDHTKALEMWHRAGELGYANACASIGFVYENGKGVKVDMKKAQHYYELAAIGGDAHARYNLGNNEVRAGKIDRALKHYMIAVRSGLSVSLGKMKELYTDGYATKEEYTKALKLYQSYLGEIKSDQRDKAAAADEENRYY